MAVEQIGGNKKNDNIKKNTKYTVEKSYCEP